MSYLTTKSTTKQYQHTVFIGGLPPEASEKEILTEISKNFFFKGKWNLVLKGKRGKKGHLGFGFIYCEREEDKRELIDVNNLSVFGKQLECKQAWSIEEHKRKTHSDRLRKLYISCLKKTTKQCKPTFALCFQFCLMFSILPYVFNFPLMFSKISNS